jgi:hypothetical protein
MSTETPIPSEEVAPEPQAEVAVPAQARRGWVLPVAVLSLLNLGLMAGVGYLAARPAPSADAHQAELTGRLSTLSLRVAALEAAAQKPSATDAALDARIAALEHAPVPTGQAATPSNTDALEARVSTLESKAAAPPLPAVDKGLIDGLDKRVAALETAHAAPDPAIIARLDNLSRDLADRATAGALQIAEGRIANLEKADNRKLAEGAALALAASLLGDKVRSGAPFAQEYATVARLTPETPALASLAKDAGRGVPNKDLLLRQYARAERAARAADEPAAGGLMGSIRQTLGSLVTVRSPGASTENSLDEIAKALMRDDPNAAVTAAGNLSPKAHTAIEPWLAGVRQRAAALAAVQELRLSALNALMRTTSP